MLQELVSGDLLEPRWDSPAVAEALDLCLSCKACASECPTGTDMAAYKAEVLHQTYRGRLRPPSHYALGFLPQLAAALTSVAGAVNRLARLPGVGAVGKRVAGIDGRRSIPVLATTTFRRWWDSRAEVGAGSESGAEVGAGLGTAGPGRLGEVVLFADSWSNHFAPRILAAAVAVLEHAGVRVRVVEQTVCCGLPLISTGQLDAAKTHLRQTIAALDATGQMPIVGVEPSCLATLKDDAQKLLADDAAERVGARVRTLAEHLLEIGAELPDLAGIEAIVQPHCHQSAVLGTAADRELLARAGAGAEFLGGCCGLAGNFGVEAGHYETSVAVAELALLPALRDAKLTAAREGEFAATASEQEDGAHRGHDLDGPPALRDAQPNRTRVVLADGYSCRTQIADLSDARGVSLAELLAWGHGLDSAR